MASLFPISLLIFANLTVNATAGEGIVGIYSQLTGPSCRQAIVGGETFELKTRCRGVARFDIVLADEGNLIALLYVSGSGKPIDPGLIGHGFGDRMEWRGRADTKDFIPQTAIVRVMVNEDDKPAAQLLAVMKIVPDTVCVMALIDAQANAEANRMAREAADRLAADFQCGRDKPRAVGAMTRFVADRLR